MVFVKEETEEDVSIHHNGDDFFSCSVNKYNLLLPPANKVAGRCYF